MIQLQPVLIVGFGGSELDRESQLTRMARKKPPADLSPLIAPRWQITKGSDQTDYKAGDETAVVRAESNLPGGGIFRLRVTFIEETLETLEAGDYEIKIVGTLVPK